LSGPSPEYKVIDVFDDIAEIRRSRKEYNLKMFRSGVATFHELENLEANAFQEGALPKKYKELIGLGISICEKCYPCVEYHITAAMKLGATQQEILEATAVALAMGGSVSEWPCRFVFKVLDEPPTADSTPH
jgi:AhpD family alkylhydroperoxidase